MDLRLPDLVFLVVGIGALLSAFLPRLLDGKPLSLPIVFLGLGVVAGLLPGMPFEAVPDEHPLFVEHLSEVVVIIALMGAGLGLDRPLGRVRWQSTWRLLGIAMPLTIAGVYVLGDLLLGLAPAGALLLGAALAPTDPVLAGEVQVGEPATEPVDGTALDRAEDEVRFGLTSEAGLNDALAFPFVTAALLMATTSGGAGEWVWRWLAVDVAYKTAMGLLVGAGVGWLLGKLVFSASRDVLRLSEHREGFVALAATFLAYGLGQVLHSYGFLAVFAAAVAVRGSERFHDYHLELHHFVEQVERLLTVLVLLLLGMALADGLLSGIGWRAVVVAAALLFVVRPLAGAVALRGSCGTAGQHAAMAFFGVRGIGSVYYVSYAVVTAEIADSGVVWSVVGLVIAASVVVHGISAGPVMRSLDAKVPAQT